MLERIKGKSTPEDYKYVDKTVNVVAHVKNNEPDVLGLIKQADAPEIAKPRAGIMGVGLVALAIMSYVYVWYFVFDKNLPF
jgi:hypothetical protein